MSILDTAFAAIFRQGRQIGPIIPSVVMRETNRDDLIVTDHPVETGAAISDHAFKRPVEVEMVCAFSGKLAGGGTLALVYESLQALQKSREPFTVKTGKRTYKNMLMASLVVTTDSKSENILAVVARFREVIIVSTQTTKGGEAAKSAQAAPEKTGSTASAPPRATVGPSSPGSSGYVFG